MGQTTSLVSNYTYRSLACIAITAQQTCPPSSSTASSTMSQCGSVLAGVSLNWCGYGRRAGVCGRGGRRSPAWRLCCWFWQRKEEQNDHAGISPEIPLRYYGRVPLVWQRYAGSATSRRLVNAASGLSGLPLRSMGLPGTDWSPVGKPPEPPPPQGGHGKRPPLHPQNP